jgi:hypothetical protein
MGPSTVCFTTDKPTADGVVFTLWYYWKFYTRPWGFNLVLSCTAITRPSDTVTLGGHAHHAHTQFRHVGTDQHVYLKQSKKTESLIT